MKDTSAGFIIHLGLWRRNNKMINRAKLTQELEKEKKLFAETHQKSRELFERAKKSLITGHVNNWQNMWASDFPIYVDKANGCTVVDVDGNEYVDFCLGDTGAMTGHSPASVDTISEKLRKGSTFMLPTEDHIWVSEELTRRFGLSHWQFALSASDANRFAIRWARFATGRKKILVFNHCYHGTVDETLAQLYEGDVVGPKEGSLGYGIDPVETTKVIEFNDVEALRKALEPEDVALVLAEPALTNISIVPPAPGFLEALRKITRETGTLLLIDETHTISEGIGGFTRKYSLDPDMFVVGKPIGSGIPSAVYGFSKELAQRIEEIYPDPEEADVLGVSTTLTGSAIAAGAIKATLETVLTQEAYDHMIPLAKRFADGVQSVIDEKQLPWRVILLGSRLEYLFNQDNPKNGTDIYNAFHDFELHSYMHLALLNKGFIITPFHNMALMCPQTTNQDVDKHTEAFREVVSRIL